MPTAKSILVLFLLCVTFETLAATQQHDSRASQGKNMVATTWRMSKGGLGFVNSNLYVVVKSSSNEQNEVIVKPTEDTEERWHGKRSAEPEVVFFYKGKIWMSNELPQGFDLARSVLISFEHDKVRFIDFQAIDSGYYDRITD